MGLMIHSLAELPSGDLRAYYLYLLDYGWDEPVLDDINRNFRRMADKASRSGAVILRGVVGAHFTDEVLSWHPINGQDAADLLPALLLTTRNPHEFRGGGDSVTDSTQFPMVLVPLRRFCRSAAEAVPLIESIFADIGSERPLLEFRVAAELRQRNAPPRAADALILEPNVAGVGVDLRKLFSWIRDSVFKTP